jgi:hypothetical protein
MAKFRWNSLCTPAIVYLVVSVALVMYIVFFVGMSALTLITKSVLIVVCTFLLNWLCSRGLSVLAWIILLLPVILVLLMASWSVDVHEGLSQEMCTQILANPPKSEKEKNEKDWRPEKKCCANKKYTWNDEQKRCNNIEEEKAQCDKKKFEWNDTSKPNRCNTVKEQQCAKKNFTWNDTKNRCNTNDEEQALAKEIQDQLNKKGQRPRRTGS